jgi:membrane protein implicated in regulation of membrane protease activity
MKFRIDFSTFVKSVIEILTGIALNMWIAFGMIAIFTMLILPTHEHPPLFLILALSHLMKWYSFSNKVLHTLPQLSNRFD